MPAWAQLGPVPLAGQAVQPKGAAAARPLSQKLADQLSILDFGAACDGVTDDSKAVLAAGQSGRRVLVPGGLTCNAPSIDQATMQGVFLGGGKIVTQVNVGTPYQATVPRGPQFSAIRLPPNPGPLDNCTYGFPCWAKYDYSHTLSAEEFHISGAATLGQPVGLNAYESMPGAGAHNLFIDNSSGWNYSHNSNDGRTGTGAYGTILQQNGAGDFGVFGAHIQCSGYLPPGDGNTTPGPDGTIINGYTDWLAVPECGYMGATMDALAPGQYLQLGEYPVEDNGNDVTAIGYVYGYRRTAPTAKINNRWIHELVNCNLAISAPLACDAVRLIGGSWSIGDDYIGANIPAPIALSANQKITLNGSVPASPYAEGAPPSKAITGGDWITDDGTAIVLAQNGNNTVRVYNPPNAVNGWQFTGSTTGNAVTIGAVGADPAVPVLLSDKGGAGVVTLSNGSIAMRVGSAAASTGYLNVAAGTSTSPLLLQNYASVSQDFGLGAAGTGLVRLVGATPNPGDSSTAVASTAFAQAAAKAAVGAMIGNRYKILNVGSGASIPLPVPAGVIDQMVVQIQPNASTIASMSLTLPASSAVPDGFIMHFISTGTITNFSLSGAGQTVAGAPGSISPTTPLAFLWDATLTTWLPFR